MAPRKLRRHRNCSKYQTMAVADIEPFHKCVSVRLRARCAPSVRRAPDACHLRPRARTVRLACAYCSTCVRLPRALP
eukprot:2451278-Pyramimonas_sp.AAC.1